MRSPIIDRFASGVINWAAERRLKLVLFLAALNFFAKALVVTSAADRAAHSV